MMNVEIAQRLAALRREKGYSQEELAEKLGLSRQAVSKWERAESSPDTDNLIALARLYKTSLDQLLAIEPVIEDDIDFELEDRAHVKQDPPVPIEQPAPVGQPSPVGQPASQQAPPAPQGVPVSPPSCAAPTTPYGPPPQQPERFDPEGYYQRADGTYRRKRTPLWAFPYPVVVAFIYLFIGFLMGLWHPGWLIFLTIPFYYWICAVIDNDHYTNGEGR
jgi:transcriptional regulator with XRE-family HTH domain